jgi:type II secretory pathway component PulL
MSYMAFIDITDGEGVIHLFGKGAQSPEASGVTFTLGEGHEFYAGELPADVEESVLSLPLRMLDFRILELPVSDPEKAREVLPYELEGLVLGPPEGLVIDAAIIGETGGAGKSRSVLAVYIKKALLKKILGGLSKLGLDPRAVTSLELAAALNGSGTAEELGDRLLKGEPLTADARAGLLAGEMASPSINLRRGELSYTKEVEKARRSLRLTTALVMAILVLLGVRTSHRMINANKDIERVETRIVRAYTDIFPGEKPQSAQGLSYKAKARLKEMREKESSFTGISTLEFLMKLQETKFPGLKLTEITLDKGLVVLRGEAASLSKVDEMKLRLAKFLSEVKISETSQKSADVTDFTITARGPGA